MSAVDQTIHLLTAFFPPYCSLHYLAALALPVYESIRMAAGGIFVAVVVGLTSGMWIGSRLPGGRAIYTLFIVLRSIPDLTLAIFCVVVVGLGPAAGTMALAVFYSSAMGKVFADLLLSVNRRPVEALRATGAGRFQIACFGLLPLSGADLVSYGLYEFESAVRASVIVGAVGAGGIGTELVGTINAFEYRRTTTLILVLIGVIAFIDLIARMVRRKPIALGCLLLVAGLAFWTSRPGVTSMSHSISTFSRMLPPELPLAALQRLPRLFLETIEIAFGGTLIAVFAGIPLALLASRTFANKWLAMPVRRYLEVLRAVPEVVWGLLLIAAVGIGPRAGILAIGLHATGSLGRLYSECFDNIPVRPVQALAAAGAPKLAIASFGMIPLAVGPLVVHTLFRLEWNVRAATVMGIIGAGGIGQALFEAQQLFFYPQMVAYIILTVALVLIVDRVCRSLRERIDVLGLCIEEQVS